MDKLAILQRQLSRNADTIQSIETHIEYFRLRKAESDVEGFLQDEYYYHDTLKAFRSELARYVVEQRYVKGEIKKLKVIKISKKHRKGEPKPTIATDWKK